MAARKKKKSKRSPFPPRHAADRGAGRVKELTRHKIRQIIAFPTQFLNGNILTFSFNYKFLINSNLLVQVKPGIQYVTQEKR